MLDNDYNTRYGTWSEVGNKKYLCPSCHKKTFVPLVYSESGQMVDPYVYGRCDREFKCRYKSIRSGNQYNLAPYIKVPQKSEFSTINNAIKLDSLKTWTVNKLARFMFKCGFNPDDISDTFWKYYVGTSSYNNATIFWQTDITGKTRTGKIINYNADTGKRIKTGLPVLWMDKILKIKNFNKEQCLFGEHLLKNSDNKVAIVESEKTALIMDLKDRDDEYIWLACGGVQMLNDRFAKTLKGKDVHLFPDIDAEDKWYIKARVFNWKFNSTRNIMEERNYEYKSGDDLADMTVWNMTK